MACRARRIVVTVAGLLAVMAAGTSTALDARAQGPGSIGFAGGCTFGAASLQMTMASSSLTIQGAGSCQGNAGPETALVDLSGQGPFGCNRGTGTMSGTLLFDPQPPDSQQVVVATAVVGIGVVHLVITDPTGDLYAASDLAWPDTGGIPGCVSSGLDGVMSYADS